MKIIDKQTMNSVSEPLFIISCNVYPGQCLKDKKETKNQETKIDRTGGLRVTVVPLGEEKKETIHFFGKGTCPADPVIGNDEKIRDRLRYARTGSL